MSDCAGRGMWIYNTHACLSHNCLDGNALRKVWFDNLSVTATALDDIRCLGEHVEKKWNYSVFPCVYSRQRVHFSHFCHYYVIEDCSKIKNKA